MINNFQTVFRAYGGWKSLRASAYLKAAVVLVLLCWGYVPDARWTKLAQSVLPNIIGFSIAAIAIITVIGDEGFRKKMAKVSTINEKESDIVSLMASFTWFIIVQMCALIFSILLDSQTIDSCNFILSDICNSANYYTNLIFSSFGFLLFLYGILLVLSSAFMTFDAFRLYIRSIK